MDKTIRRSKPLPDVQAFNFEVTSVKNFDYAAVTFHDDTVLEVGQVVRLSGSNLVRVNRFVIEEGDVYFFGAADNGPKIVNEEKRYNLFDITEIYMRDPNYTPFGG